MKIKTHEWLICLIGTALIVLAAWKAISINEEKTFRSIAAANYKITSMLLTKEIFNELQPGEIFRVVTTRVQSVHETMQSKLTFVCVKSRTGHADWAIYAGPASGQPDDIARYGQKVQDSDNIQSICPCDQEVLALYKH